MYPTHVHYTYESHSLLSKLFGRSGPYPHQVSANNELQPILYGGNKENFIMDLFRFLLKPSETLGTIVVDPLTIFPPRRQVKEFLTSIKTAFAVHWNVYSNICLCFIELQTSSLIFFCAISTHMVTRYYPYCIVLKIQRLRC